MKVVVADVGEEGRGSIWEGEICIYCYTLALLLEIGVKAIAQWDSGNFGLQKCSYLLGGSCFLRLLLRRTGSQDVMIS